MKRLLLLLIAVPLLAQQPAAPLPQRDQPTIQTLKDQIADCAINSKAQADYENKLVARIRELEKQVADLKAPPKAPALPVESKPK
jgi:hypothetical protein